MKNSENRRKIRVLGVLRALDSFETLPMNSLALKTPKNPSTAHVAHFMARDNWEYSLLLVLHASDRFENFTNQFLHYETPRIRPHMLYFVTGI